MNPSTTDAETLPASDILIVDDTPANLRLLFGMLTKQGYKVRLAPDGALALTSAQTIPPDLIMLDIKMPGMSGYEVCTQLKADPRTRDIPVIFISALNQTNDKVKAFTLGGVDYVTKPFQVEEVLARVETHLALHTLQNQLAAANAELQEANAELETSNDDLRAFAHTVAHDLKSPLGTIINFSVLLELEFMRMSPEKIADSLQRITKTGYKIRDIIDALLLFASMRQTDEVEREQLDMGAIVSEVLARLASDIEAVHAEIVVPETWPTVRSYAPWIEQVWVNYLSNALKYGGEPPRVELGFDDGNQWPVGSGQSTPTTNHQPPTTEIRFWVRDNGPGLTPEEQRQLFKSFVRLDQMPAKGHGLGLSIVRRIVEKLGGNVGIESKVGQGSKFWFVLPGVE